MERIKRFLDKVGLLPKYSELELFLTSVCWVLLFLFFPTHIISILNISISEDPFGFILFVSIFLAGLILSIHHAISEREKTEAEKSLMLFFIVMSNVIASIFSGFYFFSVSLPFFSLLFFLIHWLNVFYPIFLVRAKILGPEAITEDQLKREEIFLSLTILLTIFFVSNYVYKNHWSVTFSICIIYATNLTNFLINTAKRLAELRKVFFSS